MRRLPYMAARDARHRTAALALYRALLRSAGAVALPPDVIAAHQEQQRRRQQQQQQAQHVNSVGAQGGPIARLIRRRFKREAPCTSIRLIYAAMAAGYRFLTFFAKARIEQSPDHTDLVQYLRTRAQSAAAARSVPHASAQSPTRPALSSPLSPGADRQQQQNKKPSASLPEPLIKNIAGPGEPPHYISTVLPRPLATLNGQRRRVPILSSTSHEQPFLRIYKPQPPAMSRMIGRKDKIYRRTMSKFIEAEESFIPVARLEDEWEQLVEKQMRHELGGDNVCFERPHPKVTFAWSAHLAQLWSELQLEKLWADWTARGTALQNLIEAERALAEQEARDLTRGHPNSHTGTEGHGQDKVRRDAQNLDRRRRLSPPASAAEAPAGRRGPGGSLDGLPSAINVAEHPRPSNVLHTWSALRARLRPGQEAALAEDPFAAPEWAAFVDSQSSRLLRRVMGERHGAFQPDVFS